MSWLISLRKEPTQDELILSKQCTDVLMEKCTLSNDVPWDEWVREGLTFQGCCLKAAETFSGLILIPESELFLAKGQCTLAQLFFNAGKPVKIINETRLYDVCGVILQGKGSSESKYGKALCI